MLPEPSRPRVSPSIKWAGFNLRPRQGVRRPSGRGQRASGPIKREHFKFQEKQGEVAEEKGRLF